MVAFLTYSISVTGPLIINLGTLFQVLGHQLKNVDFRTGGGICGQDIIANCDFKSTLKDVTTLTEKIK